MEFWWSAPLEHLEWDARAAEVAAPAVSAARATRAQRLDFALATSKNALCGLEAEWNALFASARGASCMFLGFNWLWHWCDHYLDQSRQQLAIVTGRHEGRLVMVWPLVIERRFGVKTARFAGAPVSQYGDILVDAHAPDHHEWIAEAWGYITRELAVDVVHLCKVRADSCLLPLLRRLGANASNQQSAPFIGLAGGGAKFEAFDQRYCAKDRKNRRRKRKRLAELGAIGFQRIACPQRAVAALCEAMRWKRTWLEDEARVSTALADDRFDRFFAGVLTSPDRPVGAEVFELTLDGRPVAIKIALTAGDHRGMHFTAYDKTLDKCSPGALLVEEMIGHGLADGVTTLDFLAPAFAYKLDWATGAVAVCDYSLAVTGAGALFEGVYVQGLRPRLQRLLSNGPAPLRRLAGSLVQAVWRRGQVATEESVRSRIPAVLAPDSDRHDGL